MERGTNIHVCSVHMHWKGVMEEETKVVLGRAVKSVQCVNVAKAAAHQLALELM